MHYRAHAQVKSKTKNPRFPQYATSVFYWAVTVVMTLTGGALAVFYFGEQAEAIVALHVGLSAPLMLQKLTTTAAQTGARLTESMRLTDFFGW